MYDFIDDFLHQLKEYIGEHISTRYFRDITGMTTRYDNYDKVFLTHHTSNHQYYAQRRFERGSIVTVKHLVITSYTTSAEYEPRPFDASWPEGSTILYCLRYTSFWRRWRDKFPKLIIKSNILGVCDAYYIFRNYYKSLKKELYDKSDHLIDYYDNYDNYYAVDADGNDPNVITDA